MQTPTIDRWKKVTHISTGLSVVASLVMAISGYSVFVRFPLPIAVLLSPC